MEGEPINKEVLKEELNRLLSEAYNRNRNGTHEKVLEKNKELEKKYGQNRYNYQLFHLLIRSSLVTVPNFDFPGEDSVEIFIRNELD